MKLRGGLGSCQRRARGGALNLSGDELRMYEAGRTALALREGAGRIPTVGDRICGTRCGAATVVRSDGLQVVVMDPDVRDARRVEQSCRALHEAWRARHERVQVPAGQAVRGHLGA